MLAIDMASATDLEFNKVLSSASRTQWSGCLPGRKSWQALLTVSSLIFFPKDRWISARGFSHCFPLPWLIATACVDTLLSSASTNCYRVRRHIALICDHILLLFASTDSYRRRRHNTIVIVHAGLSGGPIQFYSQRRHISVVSHVGVDTFLKSATTHFYSLSVDTYAHGNIKLCADSWN